MNRDALIASLVNIVGEAHVVLNASPPSATSMPVGPTAVVSPLTVQQISAIVVAAEQLGASIVPLGSGNLHIAGPKTDSTKPYIALSTLRMNRVLDHQPDDLTVTCEAGVTLRHIQLAISPHRQMLALDAPLAESSTLGGLVASSCAGRRRVAFGAPRDLLIGVKAVTTSGVEVKGGGKVVKNVAGYDVCKLFTGSRGTLGIITELTFKVRPLPETCRTIAWTASSIAQAADAGFQLHLAALSPTMIAACSSIRGKPALIVSLEGAASRVAWQADEFSRRISALGLDASPVELSNAEITELDDWPAIVGARADSFGKASILPGLLAETATKLAAIPACSILADCGAGTISFALEKPDASAVNAACFAILRGANENNSHLLWGRPPECLPETACQPVRNRTEASLHAALKAAIDPLETFCPGKTIW